MGFLINPYAHDVGVAPAPSPADQGAVGWWDLSDGATVTLDGSSNISAVTNKGSAATFTMQQSTAARRPTTTTYNGRTVGVFDGANNEYLRIEIAPHAPFRPGTGNFSIFAAYRRIVTATGDSWIFTAGNDQDRYLIGVNAGASSEGRAHFAASSALFSNLADTAAVDYDDGTMRVLLAVRDGDTWSLYTGSGASRTPALATSSSGHAAWDVDPAQPPRIGAFRDVGQTFFEPYEGQIAEAGYFSKALSSSERDDLFRYFFDKWGT